MEVNPLLLSAILADQKKSWELLEEWLTDGTCYLHDVGGKGHPQECVRCQTEEYLKPIRAGLLKIQETVDKAREIKVIKK